MSKLILGLDIGVASVGYAMVSLDSNPANSKILKMGVRVITEDPDFHGKFYEGKKASKNKPRRDKRLIRRLNQRYKIRRNELVSTLKQNDMMPDEDLLYKISSLELFELRVKALTKKLNLQEIGRIFYHLNQTRGFESNRKSEAKEDESSSEYLQKIKDLSKEVETQTIGQYFFSKLSENPLAKIKQNIFPRAKYKDEFDQIWVQQKKHHPKILTGGPNDNQHNTLYHKIRNEIIYFQRPLKSQKGLVSDCTFELHHKSAPKSSPLFQVFRIWQQINNLEIKTAEGEVILLGKEDRINLFNALHDPAKLNKHYSISSTKILKLVNTPDCFLNFDQLEGNKTYLTLYRAFEKAGINKEEIINYLQFDPINKDDEGGKIWALWHITYSLPTDKDVIRALIKRFKFTKEQAKIIAKNTGYTSDYGSLSSRAIRKLLPHLINGKRYDEACGLVGYKHYAPHDIEDKELKNRIEIITPNSFRNPVVEQILNQVRNVVNQVFDVYGKPDEIRVELARELKNNIKLRKRLTDQNKENRKNNDRIVQLLKENHGFARVNARDILRYRLWDETERMCLYSGKPINLNDVYNGKTEIEHIIPKSRSFNNAMSNYILTYVLENKIKDQNTAYDYMKSKGEPDFGNYIETIKQLYSKKKITKTKLENLLCAGDSIPTDFLQRQIKDTQYVSKAAVKMLKSVCGKVTTTTGSLTDFLREKWELKHLMQEINLPKYRELKQTEFITIKDNGDNNKQVEVIKDWNKRDDHRHHAIDALLISLTSHSMIQKLNDLNKDFETYKNLKQSALNFTMPIDNLRLKAKQHVESLLISFKKPNSKVLTKKINKTKGKHGYFESITWAPRGSLHEDTILGKMKWYEKVPLNRKFNNIDNIVNPELKEILKERLVKYKNDSKKAFGNLIKDPVLFKGIVVENVIIWKWHYTKRVDLNKDFTTAQFSKITDSRIKFLLLDRIEEATGERDVTKQSLKITLDNYHTNYLHLDDKKQNAIKAVTVLDDGNPIPVREGYAFTKGNHHAIIYIDMKGIFQEKVVSFWQATAQCLENLREKGTIYPTINKALPIDCQLHCTVQKNDLFVIGLNPNEIDFFSETNNSLIAQNLFRVQKISEGDYWFRHQYETTINRDEEFAFKRIRSLSQFANIYKVKLNHLGQIIKIGDT